MNISKSFSILLLLALLPSIASAYTTHKCGSKNYKWNTTSIPMSTSGISFPPGPWRDAITESIDLWNRNASNLQFYLAHDDANVGLFNGQNEFWIYNLTSLGFPNPGLTYTRYSPCAWFLPSNILEADIIFNDSMPANAFTYSKQMYDSMAYDVAKGRPIQTVAIHEM